MKIKLILIFFIVLISFSCNDSKHGKLIVLITIDGLRGDLLEKYKPAFNHGFRRMFNEGFTFTNAWVGHATTVSHAGHVTIATGNHPKTHGIVDAGFYQKQGDSLVLTDCFEDLDYSIIGSSKLKGVSPKNVFSTGLGEWVKQNDPSAKVLNVGTGHISSALYCFHQSENVFWYEAETGMYTTSTYYADNIPDWVNKFNETQLPEYFTMSEIWDNIVPQNFIGLANDSTEFERYGQRHVFPYRAPEKITQENPYKSWIKFTPFIDNATLALAKQGIKSLSMGQTTSTDYLSIVLSQLDNASHDFGPSSLETFNVLMHMDKALGDFYTYLDQSVGKGNYIVALSSDHGFPEVPEQTLQEKWTKRISSETIERVMNEIKKIREQSNGMSKELIASKIETLLRKQDFIADVYTGEQLESTGVSIDSFVELQKNSYRKDRIPRLPFFSLETFQSEIAKAGLMVRLKENTIIDLDWVIHGSPYDYDRYVPLMFMGMEVEHGNSNVKVHTVDIAPTLAKLSKISILPKTDGKPLFN